MTPSLEDIELQEGKDVYRSRYFDESSKATTETTRDEMINKDNSEKSPRASLIVATPRKPNP